MPSNGYVADIGCMPSSGCMPDISDPMSTWDFNHMEPMSAWDFNRMGLYSHSFCLVLDSHGLGGCGMGGEEKGKGGINACEATQGARIACMATKGPRTACMAMGGGVQDLLPHRGQDGPVWPRGPSSGLGSRAWDQ